MAVFPETGMDTKTKRVVATFREAVRKTFSFLKETTRLDDALAKSIPFPSGMGFLVPVCKLHLGDRRLIEALARWREENAFAFPTRFPVTVDGTGLWLEKKVLDVEDRLLFLVMDRFGKAVGHLGFANSLNNDMDMEIDNVVRGEKDTSAGIMAEAMRAVLDWAEETIGPKTIFLRVLDDNQHAIGFYRKLEFADDKLQPLRLVEKSDGSNLVPVEIGDTAPPDCNFLRMVYRPARRVDGSRMILTAGPSISAREASYALDAARHGWNNEWNRYLKRFESTFADYLGVKHALATSSGTGALHLALLSLGIGPGDEVIVPDVTWVATANAVVYSGATPIFADIQPDSWCLDPDSFESKISKRTKAVMPVHLYGHPAEMDRILEIAERHGLFVVEDAAPAIGAEFRGRKAGTFGHLAAFSFQGAKLAVTGEGGMLVTDDDEIFKRAYSLWDQGRTPGTFWINEIGWKYKMSNIQAALGLGQMERVDELVEAKRRVFTWYEEGLAGVPFVTLNKEMPWARSIYWMSSLLLDEAAPLDRDALRKGLLDRNIDTRSVFPAVSQYPIWQNPQRPQPIALRVGNRAVNLPSGVRLKREEVEYVCRTIRDLLGA